MSETARLLYASGARRLSRREFYGETIRVRRRNGEDVDEIVEILRPAPSLREAEEGARIARQTATDRAVTMTRHLEQAGERRSVIDQVMSILRTELFFIDQRLKNTIYTNLVGPVANVDPVPEATAIIDGCLVDASPGVDRHNLSEQVRTAIQVSSAEAQNFVRAGYAENRHTGDALAYIIGLEHFPMRDHSLARSSWQISSAATPEGFNAYRGVTVSPRIRMPIPWPDFEATWPLEVQERAEALLNRLLSPSQREAWKENQSFIAVGSATGDQYEIRNTRNMNVYNRTARSTLCLVFSSVPLGDQLAAQKLMIEGDERRFLEQANHFPLGRLPFNLSFGTVDAIPRNFICGWGGRDPGSTVGVSEAEAIANLMRGLENAWISASDAARLLAESLTDNAQAIRPMHPSNERDPVEGLDDFGTVTISNP